MDNFITTELYAPNIVIERGAFQRITGLRKKRDNGRAGVATNNGDVFVCWVGGIELGDKATGADYIKCSDTEQPFGVIDILGLEDFCGDRNSGVDGIRDDEDVGVGSRIGCSFGKVTYDGGVGVEKV